VNRQPKQALALSASGDHSEFLAGFVRLHVLHHAAKAPLVGCWMMEELRRPRYRRSAGASIVPRQRGERRSKEPGENCGSFSMN